ncbi:predicted protein [Sclerotinia sclerotiorum 1980 UF-70]|uniref:Uncharacterized protein n=1 Tax=Sclerotinia sclerotiorum (strain ATCC 18683 / 1980 / Ss-1) TaxID=665079 RepID=A7EDM4_SCLS1|nr:predicted protein [Sclerotinia sclerotiorum 1980 UF-70]EDO00940.1 predicted protein [Sclerotinia sclerotiorum 1980 UF-70]
MREMGGKGAQASSRIFLMGFLGFALTGSQEMLLA